MRHGLPELEFRVLQSREQVRRLLSQGPTASPCPTFAVVVACHCHPAQMVGPAGGSALGAQELYLVRTSPRFELKVQGREICGEGEILGTHVSSHLQ